MRPRPVAPPPVYITERAFRSNRKYVRYHGRRWRLLQDRGRWLLVQSLRGNVVQFVPTGAVS